MVRFLIVLLLSWSAHAAPVSIDLKEATVGQFAEIVFKSIMRRDYTLGPGTGGGDPKLTVFVSAVEKDKLLDLANSILKPHGIEAEDKGAMIFIRRAGQGGGASDPSAVSWMAQPGVSPNEKPLIGKSDTGSGFDRVSLSKPDAVEVYFPRFRSVVEISEGLKLLGLKVSSGKGQSVVYVGDAERIELGKAVVLKMDQPQGVVDVRALIVEYAESSEAARSFSGAMSILAGKLGVAYGAGGKLSNALTFKDKSLDLVLSAIEGDARFKQLAEPRLRVLDGQKARIVVGSEFPVRGRVETDKGGNAVTSVEYKQAGIVLELSPQILESSILVGVKQQVSSVALTTSSGIDSPTVQKREAETTIDAQPGQLVVIGGLDDNRETSSRSGFSWLPAFLQGSSSGNSRTQILLLLEVQRVPSSI